MGPLVLTLDTATEVVAVGLGRRLGGQVDLRASCDSEAPRAAMSRLLPCVEDLLGALGLGPSDVDEVVVGRGPGSFTGVRIGVSTAKGLAHGLGVPLYGVGTLDAIAWRIAGDAGVGGTGEGPLLLGVVGDAMRGEVYPARFRLEGGAASRLEDDTVAKPEDVISAWAERDEPILLAGNGLRKYRDQFAEGLGDLATFAPEGLWSPTGAGLLAAYPAALADGSAGSGEPGALLPVYTRLSDAEEAEHDRVGAASAVPTPGTGVRGPQPGQHGGQGREAGR